MVMVGGGGSSGPGGAPTLRSD